MLSLLSQCMGNACHDKGDHLGCHYCKKFSTGCPGVPGYVSLLLISAGMNYYATSVCGSRTVWKTRYAYHLLSNSIDL